MSQLNNVKRCNSCGAVLQSDDAKKDGYISNAALNNLRDDEIAFCDKCYQSKSYNSAIKEATLENDMLTILKDAKKRQALIVYVIDLCSFEASFIKEVSNVLDGLPVLVVANKRDLMPLEANDEDLKAYVEHELRVAKLNAKEVLLVSQAKNYNVEQLLESIKELRGNKDVYIIGATGVGKSALLSSILSIYKNPSRNMIITECYPNTNVKVIRIPLDNKSFIYDTPGLGNDNSVQAKIERNALRLLLITSPIKRRNITIAKNQTILLGGLVRIDLLNDKKTALRIYISDKINIKKYSSSIINKQFNKILEKGSLHPTSTNYVRLEQFDAFDILVEEKGPRDIGIQGLGWFSFEGNDQQFRIYVPKGVSIYTSRAKIKNVK